VAGLTTHSHSFIEFVEPHDHLPRNRFAAEEKDKNNLSCSKKYS